MKMQWELNPVIPVWIHQCYTVQDPVPKQCYWNVCKNELLFSISLLNVGKLFRTFKGNDAVAYTLRMFRWVNGNYFIAIVWIKFSWGCCMCAKIIKIDWFLADLFHYSAIICTGCGLGSASCSNFAFWHRVISTNCASQFRLFLTFLFFVPLPWRFVCTQIKATTRQPCILCGWSGRLEQSPSGDSFRIYNVINFQKHAQDIFSHVPTSLTSRFQSTSSEHCTAPF